MGVYVFLIAVASCFKSIAIADEAILFHFQPNASHPSPSPWDNLGTLPLGTKFFWNEPVGFDPGEEPDSVPDATGDLDSNPFGRRAGYVPLQVDTSPTLRARVASETDFDHPGLGVARLMEFRTDRGFPGKTYPDTDTRHNRVPIIAWTVPMDGDYSLIDGVIETIRANTDSVDGVSVLMHVNDGAVTTLANCPAGRFQNLQWTHDFGTLSAGDTIYIAVDGKENLTGDNFNLDFKIALYLDAEGEERTIITYDATGNTTEVFSIGDAPDNRGPVIIESPASLLTQEGEDETLTVIAAGEGPLSFQWWKDDELLVGETTNQLTISNIQASDEAAYTASVIGPGGMVFSEAALLQIDSDRDGIADSLELELFSDLDEDRTGDFDNDGIFNGEELDDGTDANDGNEYFYRLTLLAEEGVILTDAPAAQDRFAPNTVLTLTASGQEGFEFLEWSGDSSGTTNPVTLTMDSDKTVEALFQSALGRALNAPHLTWITDGDQNPWFPQSAESEDGVESAQAGEVETTGRSWFHTYSEGRGVVRFYWKIDSNPTATLKFFIDGVEAGQIEGSSDWSEHAVVIGPGAHSFQWIFEKTDASSSGEDSAWVDLVTFAEPVSMTLAEGTDAPELPWWTTGHNGESLWKGWDVPSRDGVDSVGSGFIEPPVHTSSGRHYSSLFTRLPAPGELKFWWKVSSWEGKEILRFFPPRQDEASISGEVDWEEVIYDFVGTPSLEWRYEKDWYNTAGADQGWIDQVVFEPYPPIPFDEATDSSSMTWSTGGDLPWVGFQHSDSPDGVDMAVSGGISHDEVSWLEATVTEQGIFDFAWKVDSTSADKLTFYYNGNPLSEIGGNIDWGRPGYHVVVKAGDTLRWEYAKNESGDSGKDSGWLDQIDFHPISYSFQDALELTGTDWSVGGQGFWFGQTGVSSDGEDSLQSGMISDSESSWAETTIEGPGTLRFAWKSSTSPGDRLVLSVDGREENFIEGETEWRDFDLELPEGSHVVRWTYRKDGEGSAGSDAVWIDQLAFIPNLMEFSEGGDLDQRVWLSTGSALWTKQSATTFDGIDALASPLLGDSEESWVETMVVGPVDLAFRWKVSSESGGDRLGFSIGGREQSHLSGEIDWQERTVRLGSGEHRLRWTYSKNATGSSGDDRGWLDVLNISTATPGPGLGEAVDATDLTWTTNSRAWKGFEAPSHDLEDAAESGNADYHWFYNRSSWISTTVTGPCTVSFWSKLRATDSGFLSFELDGRDSAIQQWHGNNDWNQFDYFIPAGEQTLRWRYSRGGTPESSYERAWLDEFVLIPQTSAPLPESLDAEMLTWTTGGDNNWSGVSTPSHDGVDAAQSGPITDGEETWIETTVSGNGTLDFWWRTSSEEDDDLLSLQIDGQTIKQISGETDWEQQFVDVIGPGPHTVRWRYQKNGSKTEGSDTAWIDEVQFTPASTMPLQEALDENSLTWTTGGSSNWNGTSIPTSDGIDSAGSGAVLANQESWLQTTVTGPIDVKFLWKVSSEEGSDALVFSVDGVEQEELSGEKDWEEFIYSIVGNTTHTLRWTYRKDGTGSGGADAGWLDVVELLPILPLPEALDAPSLTFTSGPDGTWVGKTNESHDGIDAAVSGKLNDEETAWFETTLPSGGSIEFWWKVSSRSYSDYLTLFVDGEYVEGISGERDWEKVSMDVLGAGPHTVRWEYEKDDYVGPAGSEGMDRGWVDEFRFVPLASVPFEEAIDYSGGGITFSGDANWTGTTVPSTDGEDSAVSGNIGDGETSEMALSLNGAGVVSFFWKASTEYYADALQLWVDGEMRREISGETDWEYIAIHLEGGAHSVEWKYVKDESVSDGADSVWVDQLQFTPDAGDSLRDALEFTPSLPYLTGGADGWQFQSVVNNDGADAAAAPNLSDYEDSWIEAVVESAGTLSFNWKQSAGGYMTLYIDDLYFADYDTSSSAPEWQQVAVQIPESGAHTIRWEFNRNGSVQGAETAYLDQVVFTPAAPVSLPEALDFTGGTWSTSGDADWAGSTVPSHDGEDAASSGMISDSQYSSLSLDISLPSTQSIQFFRNLSAEYGSDFLEWRIDGVLVERVSGIVDWEVASIALDPGAHTLEWRFQKDSNFDDGEDRVLLDEFSLVPEPDGSLSGALELEPTVPVITTGDNVWKSQSGIVRNAVSAAASPPLKSNEKSRMKKTVQGGGNLSFWWRYTGGDGYSDRMVFYIGDSEAAVIDASSDWTEEVVYLPPGEHTVSWEIEAGYSQSEGSTKGWVDQLSFEEVVLPSIPEAVDAESLSWTTGGAQPWFAETVTTSDGIDAAGSGVITDDQESWVETTLASSGTLEFSWKVSSEETYDFLELRINGVLIDSLSGEQDWTLKTIDLNEPGPHVVRWVYIKDSSYAAGQDRGWLDEVSFDSDNPTNELTSWALGFGIGASDATAEEDGDFDQISLLEEYAYNLNPSANESSAGILEPGTGVAGLPHITAVDQGGGVRKLRIEYIRRTSSGLTYLPQFANDIAENAFPADFWQAATEVEEVTPIDADWERVVVEDSVDSTTESTRFGRVLLQFTE